MSMLRRVAYAAQKYHTIFAALVFVVNALAAETRNGQCSINHSASLRSF